MTDKFVTALNTVSGAVGEVPVGYLSHPVFKDQLVVVDSGAKSYLPEMYKSKSAEEFISSRALEAADARDADESDEDDEDIAYEDDPTDNEEK